MQDIAVLLIESVVLHHFDGCQFSLPMDQGLVRGMTW
jgi:hypothetical protein